MNDEKYIFFTERIQNTLLKPEILRLMEDRDSDEKQEIVKKRDASPISFPKDKEQLNLRSPEPVDLQKHRLEEQEKRKMERNIKLHENVQKVQTEDPQYQKDAQEIKLSQQKVEVTKLVIIEDVASQKDSIAIRLAERKKRLAEKKYENRSVANDIFSGNLSARKGASVLIQHDGFGFLLNKNTDSSKKSGEDAQEVSVHFNNSTN